MSTIKSKVHPGIKGGLSLDGNNKTIKSYYRQWAEQYDSDLSSASYSAARIVVDCLRQAPEDDALKIDPFNKELKIHDAGCGTGLVASELAPYGYTTIDGSDLTSEMVEVARRRDIYRQLWGNIDITEPPNEVWLRAYDVVICCGVFTCGHVQPRSLLNLCAMTRIGGLVIVSTRTSYYEDSQYQLANDLFIEQGWVKLIDNLRDAPYTNDGQSHYWTYVVLK